MIEAAMASRKTTHKREDPSAYALAGDEGRRAAQRALLERVLAEHDWNMAHAAAALGLSGSPGVIRALKNVAPDLYEAARADGRIRAGARSG